MDEELPQFVLDWPCEITTGLDISRDVFIFFAKFRTDRGSIIRQISMSREIIDSSPIGSPAYNEMIARLISECRLRAYDVYEKGAPVSSPAFIDDSAVDI